MQAFPGRTRSKTRRIDGAFGRLSFKPGFAMAIKIVRPSGSEAEGAPRMNTGPFAPHVVRLASQTIRAAS